MVEIRLGDMGGVMVHDDAANNRVIVELSKFENEAQREFKARVANGFYSSYVDKKDSPVQAQENNVLLGVSKDILVSDESKRDFNRRVTRAVDIHNKLKADFDKAHDVAKFDHRIDDRPVITRYGQDKNPDGSKKNWAFGEVIHRNDSYVVFASGENTTARFCRVLPTEKFLYDSTERSNQRQILDERLPIGSYKKLVWNDDKAHSITATDALRREKMIQSEQQVQSAEPKAEVKKSEKKTKKQELTV
ncbi:hypothetical protein MAFF241648_21170 [Ralstonia solanacearum]|nr:hypothetical protein MAFF241648_21170 [Ralstonia solanacearum]